MMMAVSRSFGHWDPAANGSSSRGKEPLVLLPLADLMNHEEDFNVKLQVRAYSEVLGVTVG